MAPKDPLDDELQRAEAKTASSIEYARSLGLELPKVIFDKTEWLTVKRYASEHGISVQEVEYWVEQGVISSDCTMVLPEIYNIRLVKNQPHL